jgi:competence protein ComEC
VTVNVHILDVGHGNSALALGEDWTILVDAAPSPAVLEVLDQLQIGRLDRIVISHRDADHARGIVPILAREELMIGMLFISADAAKDPTAPDTALLLAALEDAKRSGRCTVSRDLDEALPSGRLSGAGLNVEVLAPTFPTAMTGPRGTNPAGGTMTSNTVSAVLRITLPSGVRVLLPGDIDDIALQELVEKGADLQADILVFPHHGSHSAVPDERAFGSAVMRAVCPNTVLFSIGRTARIRPSEQIVRGVLDVNPEVHIACTQLSRGCLPEDSGLPADPMALGHLTEIPAAGASRCRTCAGSLTIGASGVEGPEVGAHQAYIDAVATQPICRRLRTR